MVARHDMALTQSVGTRIYQPKKKLVSMSTERIQDEKNSFQIAGYGTTSL